MIQGLLLFIHIVVCVLLILVVLVQSGKSADLAGAFGGYGSQSTFGPRGTATFLSKLTTILAILFMITSLLLWINSSKQTRSGSILPGDERPAAAKTNVPQKQAPPPAQPVQPQPKPQ